MSDLESKAHSVRARLLNLARAKGQNYNLLLTRYGIERLLFRLGQTKHADRFVLKGAMLYYLWEAKTARPTKDLDLAGFGKIDAQELRNIYRDVCSVQYPDDGILFDANSITVEEIREGEAYEGFRIKIRGKLGSASINVLVDIGIGDAITPDPQITPFPTLLELKAPAIKTYPPETVIAEKFDAICTLGMRNSRMKDYFDLWMITSNREFDGAVILKAISATFERRGRSFPTEIPVGLTDEFGDDQAKQTQWTAFCRRAVPDTEVPSLEHIVKDLRTFFEPIIQALNMKLERVGIWQYRQWHARED